MQFEFTVFEIRMEDTFPDLAAKLNKLGRAGWQVVAASDRLEKGLVGQRGQFIVILQRAIGQQEVAAVATAANVAGTPEGISASGPAEQSRFSEELWNNRAVLVGSEDRQPTQLPPLVENLSRSGTGPPGFVDRLKMNAVEPPPGESKFTPEVVALLRETAALNGGFLDLGVLERLSNEPAFRHLTLRGMISKTIQWGIYQRADHG